MASVPFNNLITFSRGSNATLTGPNGLIQWAPANLLTNSESFDNAAWTKNATTVSANSTVAPDGTSTADTVTPSVANSAHNIYASFTYTATTYTLSVYVKPNGYSWVKLGSMFTGQGVFFDVSNGVVGTANAGYTGTIIAAGNGWYRCSVTQTAAAGADLPGLYVASSGSVVSFAGDGVSGVFLWGAQLELGTAATTYNSTTVKNLLGFSEAFDNAAWTKSSASIVTGAQANPVNGAFNAQKLMENATANIHFASQSITALSPANNSYMVSVYVKAGGRNYVTLGLSDISVGSRYAVAVFNLNTGATMTTGAQGTGYAVSNATAVAVGNGWYRCSVYCTAGTTVSFLAAAVGVNQSGVITGTTAGGFESYTGDGNSGVYIYGAQLSDSASLDPYVPTPGAAPSSTAYYGPRFDYDPVTLAPKGILVEEARTNLATYSNDFADASWGAISAKNLVANSTVSPDGGTNASTLTDNSAVAFQGIAKTLAVANDNASYTATIYVRKTTGGTSATFGFNFQLTGGTLVGASPRLNTDTGALLGGTATVQNAGAYWRLSATVTNNTTGNTTLALSVYPATAPYGVALDSAAATGSAIIYGAQVEAGAFATSYIPTVASTVTRSADVATITGSLFSQWYGQSEGTFVMNATPVNNGCYALAATDGTANEEIILRYASTGSAAVIRDNGTIQANFGTGVLTGKNALAYKVNDFAVSTNGGAAATDTSGTVPTNNQVSLGRAFDGSLNINGHIRSVQYYPVRLADFQLQAITA